MRSAGFPCRFPKCEVCFRVADQGSMASLQAASRDRTTHELAAHGYVHVTAPPPGPVWTPYARPKKAT